MTGYHTRWVRLPEQEDDPERIAIREALAFYDQRHALGLSVADLAERADMTIDEIRGHRAAVPAGIEGGLRNRSPTQRPGAVSAIHSGLLITTQSREAGADRRTTTGRAGPSP